MYSGVIENRHVVSSERHDSIEISTKATIGYHENHKISISHCLLEGISDVDFFNLSSVTWGSRWFFFEEQEHRCYASRSEDCLEKEHIVNLVRGII